MPAPVRVPKHVRIPKHVQIAEDLRGRIERGELPPGARLPPQRELSRTYDVTLMTLRQALAQLEHEGLVSTRTGAGTFVAARLAYGLGQLRSLAQDLDARGIALTTAVLSSAFARPDAGVAQRLQVVASAGWVIERLRSVDGQPVVHQRSWLPAALGRRVAAADLTRRSLYDVLGDLGVEVVRAHETLQPVVLTGPTAAVLDRADGTPAFLSRRLTYATGTGVSVAGRERPVVDDEALLVGDRVMITAERVADTSQLSYQLSG